MQNVKHLVMYAYAIESVIWLNVSKVFLFRSYGDMVFGCMVFCHQNADYQWRIVGHCKSKQKSAPMLHLPVFVIGWSEKELHSIPSIWKRNATSFMAKTEKKKKFKESIQWCKNVQQSFWGIFPSSTSFVIIYTSVRQCKSVDVYRRCIDV